MRSLILDIVRERDNVSFAELAREVPGFRGDYRLHLPDNENLVVWLGMSQEAVNAVIALTDEKEIFLGPAEPIVYWTDGEVPELPLAKTSHAYKKPHWVPCVLTCKPPF